MSAWLFIKGISRETWAMSPGPSTAQSFGGIGKDDIYVPGVLFQFPSVKAAAKAAVRIHTDLSHMYPEEGAFSMVVDGMGDPKKLPFYFSDVKIRAIFLTKEGAKFLTGEPIEILPGPQATLEGGVTVPSQILPTTPHNIGWALPTIPLAQKATPYLKKTEPAVIQIQMNSKRDGFSFFSVPWKFLFLLAFSFFALLMAYAFTKALLLKKPQPVGDLAAIETPYVPEKIIPDPTAVPSPIPEGFGSVVIQTVPKNVKIFVNDVLKSSKSPLVMKHQSNQQLFKLMIKKKGYKPYTKIFNVETDTELVLNVELEKD